ncbi:MAG: lysylphosphatidylglycerol synthase transmembrane domain-containing protein [Chloroflexi bacterium]|nr:lysylphosphatidylglycerol synthase transmembrane domain-containing protein [Chloroflexota bacterium]MDA1002205.1 lysylphosphatidylglycerol synthase transmembrane domain-containing protein [Chloroflexota bacterium]
MLWLSRAVDARAVLELLGRAHAPILVLAVSLVLASLTAKALRWRSLMPGQRAPGARATVRIFFVSILVNNLLPFRLGDGVRVISAPVARALSRRQAVSVLITERLIDAATLGACALVAIPLFSHSRTGTAGIIRAPALDGFELVAVLAGGLALAAGGTWVARREEGRLGAWGRWLALFVTDLLAAPRRWERPREVTGHRRQSPGSRPGRP